MREIIFRGKKKRNNEWVEGSLVMVSDGESLNRYPCIVVSYNHDTFDWYEVFPETVGQFTGLTDKNGNKIFEGDKFAFINGQVRENDEWIDNVEEYFVEYINDTAGFLLTTGFGYDSRNCKKLDCDIIYHSEIIGNIHETNKKIIR